MEILAEKDPYGFFQNQRKGKYMNRIAYMVIRNLFRAPIWFYQVWKMSKESDSHTEQERYDYLRKLVKTVNQNGNVKVEVFGTENIPKENGYVMFPNHQGLYDALALIEASDAPFGIVIKKEAYQVILVRQVVDLLRGTSLDREDPRDGIRVIKEIGSAVKDGRNYVIFPEGTRSKKGNEVLDFKAGSFKCAVMAKCPIVPVALINSFRPFDISSIKHETVQIHFLEPLYYEQYMEMKTPEIAHLVHDRIQEEINKFI